MFPLAWYETRDALRHAGIQCFSEVVDFADARWCCNHTTHKTC